MASTTSSEAAAIAVPPEIFDKIGKLHNEVDALKRELTQGLEVWRSTLVDEKNQFDELLRHKELAWHEQENQWIRQSQAYEERLEELKSGFEVRLRQTEQNAAHALAELDDAWQREKLEWGPEARDEWPRQRRELEAKIQSLEETLTQTRNVHAEETEGHQARIQELESGLAAPASNGDQAGPSPSTVKALQNQLQEFQQTVASFQDRAAHSDELVSACVQALDYQVSVLYDLISPYTSPVPEDASSDLAQS